MKHVITFTPRCCQPADDGTAARYEGAVSMRMPSYAERLSLYEDVPEISEKATAKEKQKRNVQLMASVAARAADFVTSVAIKRLDDGYEFLGYDDLQYDSDMNEVVTEVVTRLIGKYAVGSKEGNGPSPT